MKFKVLLILFMTMAINGFTQGGPPITGGDPAAEGGQSAGAKGGAPISGNILYLLAMGAVYGFYKVKGHLKKEND